MYSKEHMAYTLEKYWSYLAYQVDEALREELSNIVYYTQHAYIVLPIDGANYLDAFLSEQRRKKEQQLEESFHDLTLQRDTYL